MKRALSIIVLVLTLPQTVHAASQFEIDNIIAEVRRDLIRVPEKAERVKVMLEDIRSKFSAAIKDYCEDQGLEEDVVVGLIAVESGGNPTARSAKGARGVMQLMPQHTRDIDPDDPRQNIRSGCGLLARLRSEHGRSYSDALRYFNASVEANKKAETEGDGTTFWEIREYLPAETKEYVPKVLAHAQLVWSLGEYKDLVPGREYARVREERVLRRSRRDFRREYAYQPAPLMYLTQLCCEPCD